MRRFLISPANIGPNRFHQSRTVSWQMSMPRPNSTILDLAQRQRKANVYHHCETDYLRELDKRCGDRNLEPTFFLNTEVPLFGCHGKFLPYGDQKHPRLNLVSDIECDALLAGEPASSQMVQFFGQVLNVAEI